MAPRDAVTCRFRAGRRKLIEYKVFACAGHHNAPRGLKAQAYNLAPIKSAARDEFAGFVLSRISKAIPVRPCHCQNWTWTGFDLTHLIPSDTSNRGKGRNSYANDRKPNPQHQALFRRG